MGMGKTEAALSLAGRFLAAGSASGLFIALPTMATSNAMLARILEAAPRLFADDAVNVVLSHGRARHNLAFNALLKKTADAEYGNAFLERSADAVYEDEAGVVCARWFAGRKRALLSQVGVGTIDQAMQAAMRVKHHFVRATGLASQVVVLDEIHAYDAYMSVILHRLLEWLGALGAPTILLSATLPAERRAAFANSYARGAFGASRPSSEISTTASYPLVTMIDREGTRTFALDYPPLDRSVTIELRTTSSPEADVIPDLVRAVQTGARVAWIRNTVGEAQEAWETARASIPGALLFHARMRGCDRQKIENHVIETFGTDGPAGGALLIATQVVEQSLDLDFDLLVTDLAPIDLVLQRSGRLHRHHRVRPVGFEVPRLIVVMPPHEEMAGLRFGLSRYVYDVATLWLAKDSLQGANGVLQVPSCIRPLVEATYNSSQRATRIEASTSRDKLVIAEEARQKRTGELEAKARTFCVAHAATDPVANDPVSDDDEHLQAMTRDGASTTLLPILWDAEAGVGTSLSGISWTLDPEASSAFHEARLLSDETVRVPHTDLEAGVRARGEAADWEAWHARMRSFLKVVGVGEPLIVPMRAQREEGAGFAGRILKKNGKAVRARYSLEKGLWFPKEEG